MTRFLGRVVALYAVWCAVRAAWREVPYDELSHNEWTAVAEALGPEWRYTPLRPAGNHVNFDFIRGEVT
jgi:hypothetical protein